MALTSDQFASGILVAYSMLAQGRAEDCLVISEGLLQLDEANTYIHSMKGSALLMLGKDDAALEAYTRAIELYPDNIDALAARGELYLRRAKFQEAAADLRKAAQLDASNQNPGANRARMLLEMTSASLKVAAEEGIPALQNAQSQIKNAK